MEIKETKEMLIGILKIATLLAGEFKDGVQASDFADIIAKISANEELKVMIMDAYNGIDKVPQEVKDMSIAEGFELATAAMPEIIALFKAVSK